MIDFITNSVFNSRTYILDEGDGAVWLVDCGDFEPLMEKIGRKRVEGVLLTHTHSDHIYGLMQLLARFPDASIVTNAWGREALADPRLNLSKYHPDYPDIALDAPGNVMVVSEGDVVHGYKVCETPGHDPSCLCYVGDDCIFTGDAYIPGLSSFAGFPNSDKALAAASQQRILTLATGRTVWAGHTISTL